MSIINDVKQKGTKKVVSKINDFTSSSKVGKNTNNTSPVRSAPTTNVSGVAKNLFKTKTNENSATEMLADECDGVNNRTAVEEIANKSACSGGKLSKLGVGAAKHEEGIRGIAENVLNDYINVQYNIVFSMIPEGKTIKIQEAIPTDSDQQQRDLTDDLRTGQAIVLASTGGAFENDSVIADINTRSANAVNNNTINAADIAADIAAQINATLDSPTLSPTAEIAAQINATLDSPIPPTSSQAEVVNIPDHNFYVIQELVIDNYVAPTNSNPSISSMISGKMKISEPGGFGLNDDIKSLGKLLGYKHVNIGRIMYRLDISFSGYDPSTGRWQPVIDMDTRKGKKIPFLTYYVIINNVEAKITNTGTIYEIDIAPAGTAALRTEDFTTDAMAVFTGTANTFGGFIDNLAEVLEQRRSEETSQGVTRPTGLVRKFEIIAPEPLRDATFYAEAWAVQKTLIKEGPGGSLISAGKDIDILTLITSALADLPYVQEAFLARTSENDNKQFVRPRTHFTVRFNVIYGEQNAQVGDYTDMTIQIIIDPFVSFKKGSYSSKTVGAYTALESQARRVKQMESLGAIIRKYEYYNTSSNTEVIDFGINLSTFFTESIDSTQDFPGTKGIGVASSAAQQEQNLQNIRAQEYAQSVQTQFSTSLTGVADNDATFEVKLSDGSVLESSANNGLTPYGVLGGGKSIAPDQYSYGGISSEGAILAARKNRYMREFKDWLANDQQQIDDLQVRGDPLWLLSPYASSDMNRLVQISKMIRPQTDSIIFIDVKAPNQKNYASPENYNGTIRKANPNAMGGFYGVFRITSSFSGGGFTQTLQGYKLNHLNYVEEGISFEDILSSSIASNSAVSSLTSGGSEISEDVTKPEKKLFDGNADITTIHINGDRNFNAKAEIDKFREGNR